MTLAARLADIAGQDAVVTDESELAYFANDIAGEGVRPALVVRPSSVEALQSAVRAATEAGHAIVPRGGGMSYTGGYQADRPDAVVVDCRGLDRVVEIAAQDGYIVVEAGCTWATLYEALKARGLRTPFFGPLSGFVATIGGAVSQHAAFFGSTSHGVSAGSVLGLEVVLADGSLLRTGSWALSGRAPFLRAAGPDLTGLFLGDCGALGVKARVALRVVRAPAETYASFAFDDTASFAAAHAALAGCDGLAECFGFDPVTNDNLRRTGFSLAEKASTFTDVARAGGGLKGIGAAIGLGLRRTTFLEDVRWSLHLVAEGPDQPAAEAALRRASGIASSHGGAPMPDGIPRATRSRPFRPIKALLGPEGERWLPVHGIVPLSRGAEALSHIEALIAASAAERETLGVRVSLLTSIVGNAFLIEPQFFWPDELGPFHLRHVTPSQRDSYAGREPRPEARAFVHRLRHEFSDALDAFGATHFQLGRHYPYAEVLEPTAREALLGLKRVFDPRGLMNPGALGLASTRSDPTGDR